MSSTTTIRHLLHPLLRSPRNSILSIPRGTASLPPPRTRLLPTPIRIRYHSNTSSSKVYTYPDIKSLSTSPSKSRLIIDVREPHEFARGAIPSAINLPIASAPDALTLPPEEFSDRFGFEKPQPEQELVFYCKAGIRSSAAAQVAQEVGYGRVGEYRGSWDDWVKQETGGR